MARLLALLAVAAALVPAPAAAAFRIVHFRTPSGNIQCGYVSGGGSPDELRCEIKSGLRPLPPTPRTCMFDWGAGYRMSSTGRPVVLCISDTIGLPHAPVLAYGRTWRGGAFTCLSRTTGLRCANRAGHGFFLSREHSYSF